MLRPQVRLIGPSVGIATAGAQERQRWAIVRLVFVIYWLLILEGVIRKWVFPEWGRAFFFVRDPFVIAVYALAFRNRMMPSRSPFLIAGYVLAAISISLIFVQRAVAPSTFDWILAIYGLRNYFLYIPLAFLVARCF